MRKRPYGFFKEMSDKELLKYTFSHYDNDISRGKLKKEYPRLYHTLWRRNMLYNIQLKHQSHSFNYLRIYKNFKKEMTITIEKNHEEFPTRKRLREMKRSDLHNVLAYYGGINIVRKKMGYGFSIRPKFYLKNKKNLFIEMKKVIKNNNRKFPSFNRLKELTGRGLIEAIYDYHDGLNAVRQKMGYNIIGAKKPNGYWPVWKNAKREIKRAIKQNHGEFPTPKILKEKDMNYLIYVIKLHGGVNSVKQKLRFTDRIRKTMPKGHWKKWKNIESRLNKIMEQNNGEFPSDRMLCELGDRGLETGIYRYHGGFSAVRERIGYNDRMMEKVARELEGILEGIVNVE